ncbi:Lysophospholipase L1 [Streptoalloteichus tenebrarius]|uniref:Lysophospholipase L1 n=1 Tax=Streptoalloteichus tenebrarius (strain ATCC 17920 / DSM 40477 / JCM 4838 / CBS 697.72 / NBRC 16177 / NCIMB 11028 / NRRL B-12390 / A12253. 1 / ISP 5477) TaxID=1933 RepID=A0ABT1HYM7_STRSD|nr:SGNH/GDSL hydrolase family protein [Streptoalloteichus tenebrarius]MCP2260635.1 Lysophospholipase L1 [Streptoalloteichus tenebrarius]BFF01519.1 SGNH/GDSL hydrolase family protein [Streptoalloteichus tenebrarius]
MHRWNALVAIGDSFTEGLDDPALDGEGYRGWADRLAERLAAGRPDFRYANLAVRGKLLQQIVDEQVPEAIELSPDLITFCAGGNDILRPGSDPDALAAIFDDAVARMRAAGADVVICTGFDTKQTPVMKHLRGKVATYNTHLWATADRHGCRVVDLWSMTVLHDPRAWSDDRLHLSPEGHERVALRACEALGVTTDTRWDAPWPPAPPVDWVSLRREDLRWAKEHFVPWIGRRLRGESSGDGVRPKRPKLTPVA